MWRGAPAAVPVRVQAKLDGVTASVNLSTERAWVSAPPNLSPRDLVDVVEAVGYTAEVAAPPGRDGEAGGAAADDASVRIDPTRRGVQAMTLHILTAAGAPVPHPRRRPRPGRRVRHLR